MLSGKIRYVTDIPTTMNGTTIHRGLPYKAALQKYRLFRAYLFSKDRPSGEYIKVDKTVDELQAIFGSQGYAPAWKWSYYKGEDLNLAYIYWDAEPKRWKQVHVRVWNEGEHRVISAHDELTPEENPKDHLDGIGFRRGRGMHRVKTELKKQGIDYTTVQIDE